MKQFAAFALALLVIAAPTVALADSDVVNRTNMTVDELPTEFGND